MRTGVTLIGGKVAELPPYYNHHGVGVFESLPVERSKTGLLMPFYERHITRLASSAEQLKTKIPNREELDTAIEKALKLYAWGESRRARLRILSLPSDWLVTVTELADRLESSVSLSTFPGIRSIPEIKSCSALTSFLSAETARAGGCYESLLLDNCGTVTECSWSNFFWVDRNGDLITPESNCLPGVTRGVVIELASGVFKVHLRSAALKEILEAAVECFITKSTEGVIPVNAIEGRKFVIGGVTAELKAKYDNLLRSEKPFMSTLPKT